MAGCAAEMFLSTSVFPTGDHAKCISWSPDSNRLAISTNDFRIAAFDADANEVIHETKNIGVYSNFVCSPVDNTVATCSPRVSCVSIQDGNEVAEVLENENYDRVVWSHDGTKLAMLLRRMHVVVAHVKEKKRLFVLRCDASDCCWLKDDQQIVTACNDGYLRLWNGSTGVLESVVHAHSSKITCIAYLPNRDQLVSCAYYNTLSMWTPKDKTLAPCGLFFTGRIIVRILPLPNTDYILITTLPTYEESGHKLFLYNLKDMRGNQLCDVIFEDLPVLAVSKWGNRVAFLFKDSLEILQYERRWSDKIHHLCTKKHKRLVFKLMCIRTHLENHHRLLFLPTQLWLLLFSFLPSKVEFVSRLIAHNDII